LALELLGAIPRRRRITLGADRGYDVAGFVDELRQHEVTPHVAKKIRYETVDDELVPGRVALTIT
jgi:IS5 family transposase